MALNFFLPSSQVKVDLKPGLTMKSAEFEAVVKLDSAELKPDKDLFEAVLTAVEIPEASFAALQVTVDKQGLALEAPFVVVPQRAELSAGIPDYMIVQEFAARVSAGALDLSLYNSNYLYYNCLLVNLKNYNC
jgi:hypothetical protein